MLIILWKRNIEPIEEVQIYKYNWWILQVGVPICVVNTILEIVMVVLYGKNKRVIRGNINNINNNNINNNMNYAGNYANSSD